MPLPAISVAPLDKKTDALMTIYELKPRFQALLRPCVRRLYDLGATANQVTIAACLVSVAIGAVVAAMPQRHTLFLLLPAWLFLRMAFNAIDGMLAREFGQASALGAYLNELTDVISDTALYLPFALLPGSSAWLVGGIVVLAIVSEMTGVVAVMTGASRRYDGPLGKSDRAFVFGLLALLIGCGLEPGAWLNWIWAILFVLTAATIANRVVKGLAEIDKSQSAPAPGSAGSA